VDAVIAELGDAKRASSSPPDSHQHAPCRSSTSPRSAIPTAENEARPHAPRLRGRDVHALRGCGHDSITASIIEALWGLSLRPEQLRSSRHRLLVEDHRLLRERFARFQRRARAHAVGRHRRNAANKDLYYIGVSGDGDSLSIGFGQFAHAIRRNVNMLYMCENNASTVSPRAVLRLGDIGTKSKKATRTSRHRLTRASRP